MAGDRTLNKIVASIYYKGQFTTTVPTSEVRPRVVELVVVSLHDTDADYIGISQAGRLVAVDQTAIAISNLVELKSSSRAHQQHHED